MDFEHSEAAAVPGWAEAVASYGQPEARHYAYAVSSGSMGYWHKVVTKRTAEVVPVVIRPNGLLLVHTKSFYPQGRDGRATYRLLSGGLHPGEELLAAVCRETHEETNLKVQVERFLGVLHHAFGPCPSAVSRQWPADSRISFTSYVFLVRQVGGELRANDAGESIAGYAEVAPEALPALADGLERLEAGWQDWGRFRATAHRFVYDRLRPELQNPPASAHHGG